MSAIAKSSAQWREAILAERASRLAARPTPDTAVERRRVCICEAGGDLVGLPVGAIARVAPYTDAAPLANAEPALLGIVSLSGGFALIYDLASLMRGEAPERTGEGHLILLRHRRPLTGLKVAATIAIAEIEILTAEEAVNLPTRNGIAAYGRHADHHIVSIIDIAALLETRAQRVSGGP